VRLRDQTIALMRNGRPAAVYPVSTAARGPGTRVDSLKTPIGIHRIARRIGVRAPSGTIFRARRQTRERWKGEDCPDDLILTRILRLEGLEKGFNKGPGVDSFGRCIYIHGTNRERDIGRPASHGCVRMRNDDIVKLFNSVREGDIVVID